MNWVLGCRRSALHDCARQPLLRHMRDVSLQAVKHTGLSTPKPSPGSSATLENLQSARWCHAEMGEKTILHLEAVGTKWALSIEWWIHCCMIYQAARRCDSKNWSLTWEHAYLQRDNSLDEDAQERKKLGPSWMAEIVDQVGIHILHIITLPWLQMVSPNATYKRIYVSWTLMHASGPASLTGDYLYLRVNLPWPFQQESEQFSLCLCQSHIQKTAGHDAHLQGSWYLLHAYIDSDQSDFLNPSPAKTVQYVPYQTLFRLDSTKLEMTRQSDSHFHTPTRLQATWRGRLEHQCHICMHA